MSYIEKIRHRIVRVQQSYFPKDLTQEDHILIREMLDPKLRSLFYEQPLCDQSHGLLVYKKSLQLFDLENDKPSDKDLFIASCFHDIAKKDARLNVTQRIIAALLTDFLPKNKTDQFKTSQFSIFRRVWIYANHSELSWEIIEPHCSSEFVKYATLHHHGINAWHDINPDISNQVKIFIHADNL